MNASALPPLPMGWPSYAYISQHVALSASPTQDLHGIVWQTPVDLDPQYYGNALYIHYGSPLITPRNTVIVTVKTGAYDGFRVEGRKAGSGSVIWMQDTDYSLPDHNWTPSCGSVLTPQGVLVTPGAGGTVWVRRHPDSPDSPVFRVAFYGIDNYNADPEGFAEGLKICTPITADRQGDIFFGFVVTGQLSLPIQSGIARISRTGQGTWISAVDAAQDPNMSHVAFNCAPGLSLSESILYLGIHDGNYNGYLVGLDSTTLQPRYRTYLHDVLVPDNAALMLDDGTSSPAVGPDGDVYYGVLETPLGENHYRGWMLHFNSDLSQIKTPGAFGWDDTPSIVPAAAAPLYQGSSRYLILTKYNNYAGAGGDGLNRLAILDPNATETDPISGATVMNEVITILGPTHDGNFGGDARREWCINNAAVDRFRKSALVNSEDGKLYRWDFTTNTLSQAVTLTDGVGEAYTPTITGPDGTVYAINNAILFAVR